MGSCTGKSKLAPGELNQHMVILEPTVTEELANCSNLFIRQTHTRAGTDDEMIHVSPSLSGEGCLGYRAQSSRSDSYTRRHQSGFLLPVTRVTFSRSSWS